jgi:hypothetical protein
MTTPQNLQNQKNHQDQTNYNTTLNTQNYQHHHNQTAIPKLNMTSITNTPKLTIPSYVESNENHQNRQQNTPDHDHTSTSGSATQNGPRKPPGFFVYPERIVKEGVSACKKSILGKIITNKPIHVSSIQMGLDNIWGAPQGLKIQEVEGKILHMFMEDPFDQERILLGNP